MNAFARACAKYSNKMKNLTPNEKFTLFTGAASTMGICGMMASGAANPGLKAMEKFTTTSPIPQSSLQSHLQDSLPQYTPQSYPEVKPIPFSLFNTANAAPPGSQFLPPGVPPPSLEHMTAFQMDGRLYPDYETYMLSEGFLLGPYQKRAFDKTGPYSLLGLFAGITGLYNLAMKSKYSEATQIFFDRHMVLSYDNRKRPWTYFTSACTHMSLLHLGANAMAFSSFAPSVGVVSSSAFITLFSALAVSSSILSLGITTSLARALLSWKAQPALLQPSVGASGAICGMLMISALSDPSTYVSILGLTPSFSILHGLMGFMALDMIGLVAQCSGRSIGLSHAGHLGGYATGLLVYNIAKGRFENKYPAQSTARYGNWVEQSLFPSKPRVIQKYRE